MAAANVIQLRQLLSEKFPGAQVRFGEEVTRNRWRTGLGKIDGLCVGGLSRGAMTEIVAEPRSCGSAFLMRALLDRAAEENQIIAVIDGMDSLAVTALSEGTLAQLLWIRCSSGDEAMKATDIVLRDSNLALVLLDLVAIPERQLRKIPSTAWYRLQRLVQESTTVCVVFTPWPMVSPAKNRLTVQSHFALTALDEDEDQLLEALTLTGSELKGESSLPNQSIA